MLATYRGVRYMPCLGVVLSVWPHWIKLWIISEFSSSWDQPCGGNGISRSGEMVCRKVVYIALKWPVPRSELPYVAIWKSWEMMLLDIKGSVCASFCVCVWGCGIMCLWQCKARVTYLPDIRHTLSMCVCVCVFQEYCPSFYLFLDVSPVCLHDSLSSVRGTVALCERTVSQRAS